MFAAAISPPIEVADKAIGLGHLRRVETEQPPGGDRTGKDRDEAPVKAPGAEAWGDRFADAPRRFVAENDRRQHLLSPGAAALGHGERSGDEGCAGMDDVAQIAVVGRRGVARYGVDLRGIGHRQFGARIEPERSVWCPAALSDEITDDPGGPQPCAQRRAGQRAGNQHRRVLDRLRRQVGRGDLRQVPSQFAGDRHRVFLPVEPGG